MVKIKKTSLWNFKSNRYLKFEIELLYCYLLCLYINNNFFKEKMLSFYFLLGVYMFLRYSNKPSINFTCFSFIF